MSPTVKLAAAGLVISALTLGGCSREAEVPAAVDAGATQPVSSENVHAFRIGELQAWALRDGTITAPNDNQTLAIGETAEATNAVLTAAGLPTDQLNLSIQPLLIRTGDRVVLFDAGGAGAFGTEGLLLQSLAAAGVQPDQVTDVLISHMHDDHVGGLVANGALAFPNAAVLMTAAEWTAMQADAEMAPLVDMIRPQVQTFAAGAEVLPGVTAVAVDGHTPGHSAYEIASGGERLLYIGDTAHHHVISVQRPDWTIAFDGDAPTAEASRRALLTRAAEHNLRIYAVHFPFPGIGRIERRGEDLVWAPET